MFPARRKEAFSITHTKSLSGMTPLAGFEVQVAAEGSAAVVARRARTVAGRKMLQRSRRAYLSALSKSGGVVVAILATQTLARAVLRMTKSDVIRRGIRWRSREGPGCVTYTA